MVDSIKIKAFTLTHYGESPSNYDNSLTPINQFQKLLLLTNLLFMNLRKLFGLLAVLCLMTSYSLSAQSESAGDITFHQGWTQLPEDAERHTEVAYAVVNCNQSDVILFNIFNETGDQKDIALTIHIVDGEQTFDLEFAKRSFGPTEMLVGECHLDNEAKIAVPDGMNPSSLTVSVTYK